MALALFTDLSGMKRCFAIFAALLLTMVWANSISHAEPLTRESQERLGAAIQVLLRSETGASLLLSARKFWSVADDEDLVKFLRWGQASRTDAVLIRHFNSKTGSEDREREVTIFLRSNQRLEEVVLDLAHELSHAVSKPVWDPYDPELTASDYMHASIEGPGGEVEAVWQECSVARELQNKLKGDANFDLARCERYIVGEKIARERIRQDFYRVGSWYPKLLEKLGSLSTRFPYLSPNSPRLYSSTGHTPYPVALVREFDELNARACENSQQRLKAMGDRRPASAGNRDPLRSVRVFLDARCASQKS